MATKQEPRYRLKQGTALARSIERRDELKSQIDKIFFNTQISVEQDLYLGLMEVLKNFGQSINTGTGQVTTEPAAE